MILALLLLVTLARAEQPQGATYERLFGAADGGEIPVLSPADQSWSPTRLLAPLLLAGLGVAGVLRLRKGPKATAGAGQPIHVLAREVLSDKSALLLVEVEEPEGGRRRLVVGVGGGAPVLVSDLGTSFERSVIDEVLAERLARAEGA